MNHNKYKKQFKYLFFYYLIVNTSLYFGQFGTLCLYITIGIVTISRMSGIYKQTPVFVNFFFVLTLHV